MIKRNPVMFAFSILGLLVAMDLALMVSGYRILVAETYIPEFGGSIGSAGYLPPADAQYSCTYFTGRKQVYETLPADRYDECPFIWDKG